MSGGCEELRRLQWEPRDQSPDPSSATYYLQHFLHSEYQALSKALGPDCPLTVALEGGFHHPHFAGGEEMGSERLSDLLPRDT